MAQDETTAEVDSRIASLVIPIGLDEVAAALERGRDDILARWLEAAQEQPFHRERPQGAVADHLPALFDAIVDLIRSASTRGEEAPAPLDDPRVADAAGAHARMRFEQGLGPVAVITEFRLLRQEISRALARLLDEEARPRDVVGGLAIVSDALDGAASIGLAALSDRIETLRESFLATTIHDIKQPITLLGGHLHLAARWLQAEEVDVTLVRGSVDDALGATNELMAMVDTLSDASRVAMGRLEPEPEPASLAGIVRETLEALGAPARERIVLELGGANGQVIGLWDAPQIRRVTANVIGNALKYSPEDTRIRVHVGPGSPGHACLEVSDEGLGMTEEERVRAFERFVRGERARAGNIPGLGLGLYACHGIVIAHGGRIELRSDGPGQGTTVTIELPVMVDEPPD